MCGNYIQYLVYGNFTPILLFINTLQNSIDTDMIDSLIDEISQLEYTIKQIIGPNKDLPKVLLFGIKASGKSSLSCNLANLHLQVEKIVGNRLILKGKNVQSGGGRRSRQPYINVDSQNRFIVYECPDLEYDIRNEIIINSFIIDYLLEYNHNKENRVKIILVVSQDEIEFRHAKIMKSFEKISEMLITNQNIQSEVGIVISKVDPDFTIDDYIEELKDYPAMEFEEWINFLEKNKHRVFLFPRPKKIDLNKNYTLPDHDKIIDFITHDFIINPKHRLELNDHTHKMRNILLEYSIKVKDVIFEMFKHITFYYQNVEDSKSLDNWFKTMNTISSLKIDNIHDLYQFIIEHIPNVDEFKSYFKELERYESFDSFINRVLESKVLKACIKEPIQTCLHDIVGELSEMIKKDKVIEAQQKDSDNQMQIIAPQQNE